MKKQHFMKHLLLALAVATVVSACSSSGAGDKKAELEKLKGQRKELEEKIKTLEEEIGRQDSGLVQKTKLVSVAEIAQQPFTHYIELQGKIDAEDNVLVTPQIPGAITQVYVVVGQKVAKGQVLAETDNEASKKNVETIKTQLAFAEDIYKKQKALWDQKIGTEVQYLSAKNNVETLQGQLAAANAQLDMTRLISPITGVVDAVDIKAGQVASPGFAGIRVVNFSNLKAKGEVSENYSSVVHEGDQVVILVPDLKTEISSKISYVAKVINPQSRTFTVESRLSSSASLKPNMIAVLKIVDYEQKEAVVIDVNLIQKSGDGSFVYVAKEDGANKVAQRQAVTVGKIYAGKAEITSGLAAGDKVVTVGYQELVAGQALQY
jgi:RND family efflux transporter MFP subunit